MEQQVINELIKFVLSALGIVGTYLLAVISAKVNADKKNTVAKTGAVNYNHAIAIAKGMYLVLEDEFASATKAGIQKRDEMEARLLNVIPELTKDEIDSVNKEIWNVFNEGFIKPILAPAEDGVVAPVAQPVAEAVVPTETPVQ